VNGVRRFAASFIATGVVLTGLGLPGATASTDTFPGTNGRILYFSRLHRHSQIFSVRPDGTGVRQLTDFKKGSYIATATADGRTIAFNTGSDIWTMHADGSGKRRLTSHGVNLYPAISPDGSQIAFMRGKRGILTLAVMRSDGTGRRDIVSYPRSDAIAPDWSPDGTTIAFTRQPLLKESSLIYTVKPNGTALHRVPIAFSPDTIESAMGASWSPDGMTFAFFAQPVHNGHPRCPTRKGYECQDLYTVSTSGGVPTRLTRDRTDDYYPIWSPDGTQITYSHDATVGGCQLFANDCRFDVFVMNADGTGAHAVTGTRDADDEPVWWMTG
jgi:Tol biopolymer transport system component